MADFLFSQFSTQNIKVGTDIILTTGRDAAGVGNGTYIADSLANAALFAAHPRFVGKSSNNRYFRAMPDEGRIDVALSGAAADGLTDDGEAIRAAFAYASAIGADGVRFGRKTWRMESIPLGPDPLVSGPQQALLLGAEPATLDFGGAEFSRSAFGRNIVYTPAYLGPIINLPLIADVAPGDQQVRLSAADAAQLAVGDMVLWQLGELPYDIPETLVWDSALVTGVNGEWVTLDKPIPQGLLLSSVTGPNKRLRKMPRMTGCTIRDVVFAGPNIAESGIELYYGKHITIERAGGRNLGAGVIVAGYCDGLTAIDCWQDGTQLIQASYGPAFNFAECRDVVLVRPQARSCKSLIRAEAGAEVQVTGGHFENTLTDANGLSLGQGIVVIDCAGRGNVSVRDLTVTGFGGYRLVEVNNGVAGYEGTVQLTGTIKLRHPTMPFSLPVRSINGLLDMEIGGVREVHDFSRLRRWKRRFQLRDNQRLFAFGPRGVLARASVFTSSGVTVGVDQQLTGLWLGREGNNGVNLVVPPFGPIASGSKVVIPVTGGTVAGTVWNQRNDRLQLLCVTAPGTGLDAAGAFVEFEGWFATRREGSVSMADADWLAAGDTPQTLEAEFPDWDIPAVAAGGNITIDLPIPAMSAADHVESIRIGGGLDGLALASAEPLTGLLRLELFNPGSTAIDRAPCDIAVRFGRERLGR